MTPASGGPVRYVSAAIIRQLFNEGKYWERALAGELVMHLGSDRVPRRLPPGEPPGTRSQIIYYYDAEGEPVAVVHQYLRPDGSLGASGRPDPKQLLIDGVRVIVEPPHQARGQRHQP